MREGGFQFAKVDLLMVFVTLIGLTVEGGGGGGQFVKVDLLMVL